MTPPDLKLIETLGWHPGEGLRRHDRHLARLARSAAELGFAFDEGRARACLSQVQAETAQRCRLTLAKDGKLALTTFPLEPVARPWHLKISSTRLKSADVWLRHKTTHRAVYDNARATLPQGIDEYIFLNENNEFCEGTITNLFVDSGPGPLSTPPVANGLLPGILREELLARGEARETTLALGDLRRARGLFVGNSLRGLIPAVLA